MPMPPRHPAAGGGRERPSTAPKSCLLYTSERSYGDKATTNVKGTVGNCVRALAPRSYRSLTARTTVPPAQDSLCLMVHSRAREREDSVGLLSLFISV